MPQFQANELSSDGVWRGRQVSFLLVNEYDTITSKTLGQQRRIDGILSCQALFSEGNIEREGNPGAQDIT